MLGVTVFVSPANSITLPLTPKIFTPDLIFPAMILLSIEAVTALAITVLYPSVPLGGVNVCAVVEGVIVRLARVGSVAAGIADIVLARLSKFWLAGSVAPLLLQAV